jgi:hypothetical protein
MKTSDLRVENVDSTTPEQEREFWRFFGAQLGCDDGAAARAHLAAGNPIYYREQNTPVGHCIKKYPDGRRELVKFDLNGEHVIGPLSNA